MNSLTALRTAFVVSATTCLATAQNFNVDVGQPGSQPPASYAAAGIPGVWNSVLGTHTPPFTPGPTPSDIMLVDTHGNPTGVGFHQFGGMDYVTANDPSIGGNPAALLNDYLATHSTSLEDCMYLNGLENGTYEVITYSWMPNSPSTIQNVRFDFNPGIDPVGGAWPGSHAEGITYSRRIIEVTTGFIGWHVGIPGGGATHPGAALNGFQIRLLGTAAVPALPTYGMVGLTALLLLVGSRTLRRRQRQMAS